jgi:hypothetical protein
MEVANKRVLDVCCGGRMFRFDKKNPDTLFVDHRTRARERLTNRQFFEVAPDHIMDFRQLDLPTDRFSLVVFDPPHLKRAKSNSYMAIKYGVLDKATWQDDLRKGFVECFRVLKSDGVPIFKWSEIEIPLKELLALTSRKPLFGHTSGLPLKDALGRIYEVKAIIWGIILSSTSMTGNTQPRMASSRRSTELYIDQFVESRPMTDRESEITDTFQVERKDGSQVTVTEETEFLIHKGDGYRAPVKREWLLDGDSLIRDPSDHSIFRNDVTGEMFRRIS